ncbi:hypothetical protein ACWD5V_09385 [Streptomyces sp. NPDC002523]
MAEPLSPEREQEIRESIPTVYEPPWSVHPDMEDDTWHVMYATDHPLAGLVAVVPDYGAHLAEFIATARAAVPELLDEIERLRDEFAKARAEAFLEAAAAIDNDDECDCGGCDSCQPRKLAAMLREKAGKVKPTPVVVSRYDVVIEPAPDEEPVLTVGALAEDGRPVALFFDEETRRRIAGWLAPDVAELLASASSFEIPWPGHWRPLLLQRSYAGGDRWWIGDREGRRWHREHGFVYEAQNENERTRTDTRFPLAEAWPLAQRIAADEAPRCATGDREGAEQ